MANQSLLSIHGIKTKLNGIIKCVNQNEPVFLDYVIKRLLTLAQLLQIYGYG
jgi:hypothetical protein